MKLSCYVRTLWPRRRAVARTLTCLALTALVVCLATSSAVACPSCKEALATGEAGQGDIVRGFFWSILLMMSTPFVVVGGLGCLMYREVRKGRAAQTVAAQTAAAQSNLAAPGTAPTSSAPTSSAPTSSAPPSATSSSSASEPSELIEV